MRTETILEGAFKKNIDDPIYQIQSLRLIDGTLISGAIEVVKLEDKFVLLKIDGERWSRISTPAIIAADFISIR